jgi:hypothetical protein
LVGASRVALSGRFPEGDFNEPEIAAAGAILHDGSAVDFRCGQNGGRSINAVQRIQFALTSTGSKRRCLSRNATTMPAIGLVQII